MPTERAYGVIIASTGVVSVRELSTVGNGLILLQGPLTGPLTGSQKLLLSICV